MTNPVDISGSKAKIMTRYINLKISLYRDSADVAPAGRTDNKCV